MKKITLLLFLLSSNIALAQLYSKSDTDRKMELEAAKKGMEYMAATVGYAKACDLPVNQANLVEQQVLNFVQKNNIKFNKTEVDHLIGHYEYFKNKTIQKKDSISKVECKLFEEEFTKIIKDLTGGLN